MRNSSLQGLLGLALVLATAALPAASSAQEPVSAMPGQEQIVNYAKTWVAVSSLRDQIQAELAEPKNKKDEPQKEIREKLHRGVAQILLEHKLTEAEYDHLTFVVSTDQERRKAFEEAVAQIAVKKKEP